jgi:hypothetical protein
MIKAFSCLSNGTRPLISPLQPSGVNLLMFRLKKSVGTSLRGVPLSKRQMKPKRQQAQLACPNRGRRGLANDLTAWGRSRTHAFGSSRRFSARFGQLCRSPNLPQNRWHDEAHLPWRDDLPTVFPGAIERLPEVTSQNQLVHGGRHHQTPALKLFRGAHPHLGPEQILRCRKR